MDGQEVLAVGAAGARNDPDMLEVGNGGMTDDEYRDRVSLWAAMVAPLLTGNDLRAMLDDGHQARTIREVQGKLVRASPPAQQVWATPLTDGSRAVVQCNRASVPTTMAVSWSRIGQRTDSAEVRDLLAHEDRDSFERRYSATVPSHCVVMIRVTPVGT